MTRAFRLSPRDGLNEGPGLRLDLQGVRPDLLAAATLAEIERLPIALGRQLLPLAECFTIKAFESPGPMLQLVGDCSHVDRLGWGLEAGEILVDGPVGDQLGVAMRGGRIRVRGDAGDQVGLEMAGGQLRVDGSVGDFAGATLPGSLDGMRGGLLVVCGTAGDRLADRMRRGTLIVAGDVGDWAASRLVAGTVVLGGRCGAHPGYGQRRGSLVWLDRQGVPATRPVGFLPAGADAPVAWQLLARSLAGVATQLERASDVGAGCRGALARRLQALPGRRAERWLGDLAVDGFGEWWLPD